jgi:serine protease
MRKLKNIVLPAVGLLALSSMTVNAQSSINANSARNGVQANPLNPGIIIKYKSTGLRASVDSVTHASQLSTELGVNLEFKRVMSGGADVLTVKANANSFARQSNVDLNAIIDELNKRADVEFAEIDAWIVPYATPNDTAYNTQWHYYEAAGGMNLPTAWDTTTGSPSVTVAVLDTGYRPHADLAGNVVGQYDMISSTAVSVDGDGRDANAQDPGDYTAAGDCGTGSSASDSSWHGTHVAGTVAAVSNNNNDVAGVAWNIGLVPVRVLGKCGGSLSDIADGIRWAAGLSVSGVPANPNPADVINMSLGSGSPAACSSTYQNAINAAVNAGTTVVVAAGNDNATANFPPGNCNNVITVGATNRNGGRAYYSNYGSTVDVAAPGGDGCNPIGEAMPTSLADCEGGVWSSANMIQSTYNAGTTTPGADSIGALQGTSMATPHVAGLAALMYSVKPTATPAEIESTMKSSARAFPSVSSHQCTTANCGAGIVDSNAAVLAMGGTTPPPTGNNVLTNGVAKTGLSGATNNDTAYTMDVPSGATNLKFAMSGGTGDADLYVKFGSAPTTSSYDCRSWASGNTETCNIASAQTGTYHVLVHAYSTYSGASLTGSYTTAAANVAPTASFTSSCTDLTCSFNGSASSDSDGTISSYSWSFGGTGATVSNTFASAGTYAVTLTVTDNDGATDSSTQNVTVTAAPVNVAPTASFTSSCTDLTCSFNGSASSDSDGSISSYSWSFGSTGVTTSNTFASAGTYTVTLTVSDNDGATDSVSHSVTVTAPPVSTNVLQNGVAKTGLSGSTGTKLNYTMVVPAGASNLKFVMSGGTGDADLYVRFGAAPTTSNYDCRSWASGNSETCNITTAQAGTYYVMINAYSTFSGASLTGSYTASGGGTQQSLFSNTTNVNIPDNNSTGATSSISVNRTGASNSVKITYNIVHTYIGDLKVQLIDPTGAVSTLRSNTGGSANNINESKTVNKGSTSATGTWKLKVIDSAGADIGYINSWSIEFL